MTVFLRGGEAYHYEFMFKGTRYRGSTGETDRRRARNFEKQFKDKLKVDAAQVAVATGTHPTKPKNMTVEQACSAYFSKKGINSTSAHNLQLRLKWISGELGPTKLITEIIGADVAKLVQARKELGNTRFPGRAITPLFVNQSTVYMLRRVFYWARDEEQVQGIRNIKWGKYALGGVAPRKRILSPAELARLRAAMDTDGVTGEHAAFEFALCGGQRRENFTQLRWDEVFIDEGVIRVIQKGGSVATTLITSAIRRILEAQLDENGVPYHSEFVFTFIARQSDKREGKIKGRRYPLTYEGFGTWWQRLCAKAGVKNARIHDIRKTAGAHILLAPGGLKAAQKLLNHADISLTAQFYAEMEDQDFLDSMEEAYEKQQARQEAMSVDAKIPHKSPHKGGKP